MRHLYRYLVALSVIVLAGAALSVFSTPLLANGSIAGGGVGYSVGDVVAAGKNGGQTIAGDPTGVGDGGTLIALTLEAGPGAHDAQLQLNGSADYGIYMVAGYDGVSSSGSTTIAGSTPTGGHPQLSLGRTGTASLESVASQPISLVGASGVDLTATAGRITLHSAGHLTPAASPPSSPTEGDFYYDTSHALCLYNGSGWDKISGAGTCA